MKKVIKIVALVVIVGALGYAGYLFLESKGVVQKEVNPYVRTGYSGQVSIEPVVLADIEAELKARNIYHTVQENSIEVYPHGPGWGPISFTLTQNLIQVFKDIHGLPDKEKFKEEVRQDIRDIGGIITIKENTWGKIKTMDVSDIVY